MMTVPLLLSKEHTSGISEKATQLARTSRWLECHPQQLKFFGTKGWQQSLFRPVTFRFEIKAVCGITVLMHFGP